MSAAQGTWAWACEQMLVGEQVRRPELGDYYSVGLDASEDVWSYRDGAKDGLYALDADDLRATDWEIAK